MSTKTKQQPETPPSISGGCSEAICQVANKFGVAGIASIREHYSGRGMFGEECVGIVTKDPTGLIEEAGANGLRGAKTDSMGKDFIVYWEKIKAI